jgi:hypothetical protein
MRKPESENAHMAEQSTLLWRRLDQAGAEYCALRQGAAGWQLAGHVVVVLDTRPFSVRYQITCDPGWVTLAVRVEMSSAAGEQVLDLTTDYARRWWSAGTALTAVTGCLDIDLEVTPSTNMLPIRRLELPVGGSVEVLAAWIQLTDLRVSPLAQRYTRLGENRYRYESGTFNAELETDELGLVRRYDRLWVCEAAVSS